MRHEERTSVHPPPLALTPPTSHPHCPHLCDRRRLYERRRRRRHRRSSHPQDAAAKGVRVVDEAWLQERLDNGGNHPGQGGGGKAKAKPKAAAAPAAKRAKKGAAAASSGLTTASSEPLDAHITKASANADAADVAQGKGGRVGGWVGGGECEAVGPSAPPHDGPPHHLNPAAAPAPPPPPPRPSPPPPPTSTPPTTPTSHHHHLPPPPPPTTTTSHHHPSHHLPGQMVSMTATGEALNATLTCIEPAKNSDKFYIMQVSQFGKTFRDG